MNASFSFKGAKATERTKLPERRLRRTLLYAELLILECLVIVSAFYLCSTAIPQITPLRDVMMLLPLYLGWAFQSELYTVMALTAPRKSAGRAIRSFIYACATLSVLLFAVRAASSVSAFGLVAAASLSVVSVVCLRLSFGRYAYRCLRGSLANELLLIDDVELACSTASHQMSVSDIGFELDLGCPEMLLRLSDAISGFERVIISCSLGRRARWALVLRGANVNGEVVAREFVGLGVIGLGLFAGHDTHIVSRGALDSYNRAKKRLLDILLTVPALLALMPLLLIIAVVIRIDSPGPVIFRQARIGRANRMFQIMKFRSMRFEASDSTGRRSASRVDDRITAVGRILRATSMDELPQLFNVLLGDMSLVGPRPHALGSQAGEKLFWEIDQKYWLRHALKPGITGLAQVRGYRGATDVPADLINRLSADLEYIESWTLGRELLILMRTFSVVIHRNAF